MDTTHTGSLVNAIQGGSRQRYPEVGMGATILMWTDRNAATIVEVKGKGPAELGEDGLPTGRLYPTTVVIQEDNAKRVDSNGMSESQTYEYTPNTDAPRVTYTRRRNGQYVRQGEPMKGGQRIAIGYRDTYYDFSF